MHMKNQSWLFCYLSPKEKKPKLALEDSHTNSQALRILHKSHLLIFSSSLEKGKQQSWPMALVPSFLPGALLPGVPQREMAVYTLVCDHTLPIPLRAHGVQSQCTAGREKGDRNSLQWAKRLHLPVLQPNATAPGPAFTERSGSVLD